MSLTQATPFAGIVGESNCIAGAGSLHEFSVDGLAPRSAVFPCSEGEVASVLASAAERGLAVIARGGGTKLGIGSPPSRYDLALSLARMDRILHFEPADLTARLEPGVPLGVFQDRLRPHGLWLPLDPPGGLRSTLGGIVASNASGPLRLRYGTARDFVLGLRIASPEGKVVKTGGQVVKNVAGYDLARLVTGSFGTLGVVVEISLKLFPLPLERASWRVSVPDLESARRFRRAVLQSPLNPMRMVLLDAGAAALARPLDSGLKRESLEIWMEAGGTERVIGRFSEEIGGIARTAGGTVERVPPAPAEAVWSRISDVASFLPTGDWVLLKATVPVAASETFAGLAAAEAANAGVRHATVSDTGVGVVRIHLGAAKLASGLAGAVARLRTEAVRLGGALIVEQAPPELKSALNVWGAPGSDFLVMTKLKQLWDPKGTLAPGRFVGGL